MDYKKLYEEQKEEKEKLDVLFVKKTKGMNALFMDYLKLKESTHQWKTQCQEVERRELENGVILMEQIKKLKEANSKNKYMNMDIRCPIIQGIDVNLCRLLQSWSENQLEDIIDWNFEEGKEAMFYEELCNNISMELPKYIGENVEGLCFDETWELMENYEANGWVKIKREWNSE